AAGEEESAAPARRMGVAEPPRRKPSSPQKLSYKLQRELDALPDEIERLENEAAELERRVADPNYYRQPRDEIEAGLRALDDVKARLEAAVERCPEHEEESQRLAASREQP